MKEWQQNEYFDESWRIRIQKLASYIEQGEIVADLGCGKQWLREYLPSAAEYVPVDYKERSEDTLVCDFNRHEYPSIFVDVAVISGVIEYIRDVPWFVDRVVNHTAKRIVFSYCSIEAVPSFSQRKKNMWVNNYSSQDIQLLFTRSGFELTAKEQIGANIVFVMTRRISQQAVGVIIHEDNPGNLGDFTQALAAKVILGDRYYPIYLHRESLHLYRGKRLPLICNGWFSHNPVYPPSERLVPLYVSLHITPGARKWFSTGRMVEHLKKYEPIGCRDRDTRDFLGDLGISAYFSGCLTYSLGVKLRERWPSAVEKNKKSKQVYFVDPPVRLIKKPFMILMGFAVAFRYASLVPKIWPLAKERRSMLRRCLFIVSLAYQYRAVIQKYQGKFEFQTQYLSVDEQRNYEDLFLVIQNRLFSYYQGQAVVTGRIHVAIPALFSGSNVIYMQPEKLGAADIPRVSDHARVFTQIIALGEPDFGEKIVAAIGRDGAQSNDAESLPFELIKEQIKVTHEAVKEFYENTDFH